MNPNDCIENDLVALTRGHVLRNQSMSQRTRWKIGGNADVLVYPGDIAELSTIVGYLHRHGLPWITMGHTSNLLVDDHGIRGIVLVIAENLSGFAHDGQDVVAEAGMWVPGFASRLGRLGLSGAEHIIGIPGTLGGLVCMNGGSMRRGIGENVVSVTCLDRTGQVIELDHAACEFGRRTSRIQRDQLTVTKIRFRFDAGNPKQIRREMRTILASRRKKFPLKMPNCGSVFVSDPANYASFGPPGAVIERCGLKGCRIGDAQVSPRHANFIVNLGNASAGDTLKLIQHIRTTVLREMQCDLRCEVRFLSSDCQIRPAHEVAA
ncbi:MAG: UDP-N-acetylmuramate dehydrogenase [Planctomycetota bacterium]